MLRRLAPSLYRISMDPLILDCPERLGFTLNAQTRNGDMENDFGLVAC